MAKRRSTEARDNPVSEDGQENGLAVTTVRPKDAAMSIPSAERSTALSADKPAAVSTAVVVTTKAGEQIEIRIDPEFRALLPAQSNEELEQLEANIKADQACLEPLIVWRQERILLDGHSRLPILQQYGIRVLLKWIDLPDRDAARDWIVSHQAGRRNVTQEFVRYSAYCIMRRKLFGIKVVSVLSAPVLLGPSAAPGDASVPRAAG